MFKASYMVFSTKSKHSIKLYGYKIDKFSIRTLSTFEKIEADARPG
jgi:hypothetical protein